MKYVVYLFDDTYKVVDEKDYPNGVADIEMAMIEKKPIRLDGSFVSGSSISRIEVFGQEFERERAQLSSGYNFENGQGEMFRIGKSQEDTDRDKIYTEIRATLKKAGADNEDKRQYVANIKLAKILHGDETKSWDLNSWEEFKESHPDPLKELEDLKLNEIKSRN